MSINLVSSVPKHSIDEARVLRERVEALHEICCCIPVDRASGDRVARRDFRNPGGFVSKSLLMIVQDISYALQCGLVDMEIVGREKVLASTYVEEIRQPSHIHCGDGRNELSFRARSFYQSLYRIRSLLRRHCRRVAIVIPVGFVEGEHPLRSVGAVDQIHGSVDVGIKGHHGDVRVFSGL